MSSPETSPAAPEVPPLFPIKEIREIYQSTKMPELEENVVTHYLSDFDGRGYHRFKLLRLIEDLHYIFSCAESLGETYTLNFKTEEYVYARTDLSKEGQEELAATLAAYLRTIACYKGTEVDNIRISPADESFSADDIEACTDAVLTLPGNTETRDELLAHYKNHEIFDRYQKLAGKDFIAYGGKSMAEARSRYFQNMFRKNLTEFEVEKGGSSSFNLKKKAK